MIYTCAAEGGRNNDGHAMGTADYVGKENV